MKKRDAFTLLEMVFVIVIIGVIAKFGVEFFVTSYKNFIFSKINHNLQSDSEMAIEIISKRLNFRIKDSVIARASDGSYKSIYNTTDSNGKILEWIGNDIDGFLGNSTDTPPNLPNWSGIIDLDAGNATKLVSPQTKTDDIDAHIKALSSDTSTINDVALYFIGKINDINGYGWGGTITDQKQMMHPVKKSTTNSFTSSISGVDFSGVEVYEYYKLAWSAYALSLENNNLYLYYNYQPWMGESYKNANKALVMKNVSSFSFTALDTMIKIKLCIKSDLISTQGYAVCKEKSIF